MSETEHKRLVPKLLLGVVVMFGFAMFVMPPLYDLMCDVLGISREYESGYEETISAIDETRIVRVQFLANNQATMPWDFAPQVFEVEVHPGEPTEINYLAKNKTRKDMVAQAVPSITPFQASNYFHKTECFCFNSQPLAAGESAELGLVFIVDRELPKAIHTITLSYSLFDITPSDQPVEDGAELQASAN